MKTKFYSLQTLLFTLLFSFGFAQVVNAQSISLDVYNFTTGGDGTSAAAGNVLVYTITVTGGGSVATGTVIDNIPQGTAYIPVSTTLNGNAVADINNNTMPYATGGLVSLTANSTIVFRVKVTSNIGAINNNAVLQVSGMPDQTVLKTTQHVVENSCDKIYTLTTKNESGTDNRPKPKALPYQYIRTMNPVAGSQPSYEDIYDGTAGDCYEAPINWATPTPLPAGSILTDGSAMAFFPHYYRIYFVNKNVGGVASDLCYINMFDQGTNNTAAYRFTNLKLTPNSTSDITRMTFDALGTGYALTEDGLQFVKFTIDYWAGTLPTIYPPVLLTNDPGNGAHDFLTESGGDICSDGSGKLYFIPNSGNVYVIDPATYVARYVGTISGMPAGGCKSVSLDPSGYFYIGGAYEAIYKVAISTLTCTQATGVYAWATADFAGCAAPISNARVGTNTTVANPVVPGISGEVSAKVQPNPFHSELNLQVQLNTTEQVRVQLVDFFGRTVYTSAEKLSAGVNSLRLSVPAALSAGIYVVEVWAGDKRLVQKKLVKQ